MAEELARTTLAPAWLCGLALEHCSQDRVAATQLVEDILDAFDDGDDGATLRDPTTGPELFRQALDVVERARRFVAEGLESGLLVWLAVGLMREVTVACPTCMVSGATSSMLAPPDRCASCGGPLIAIKSMGCSIGDPMEDLFRRVANTALEVNVRRRFAPTFRMSDVQRR